MDAAIERFMRFGFVYVAVCLVCAVPLMLFGVRNDEIWAACALIALAIQGYRWLQEKQKRDDPPT